jgi:hypothetical protein
LATSSSGSPIIVLLHRDRLDARLELVDVIKVAKEQRDPKHPTSGFGRLRPRT